MIEVLKFIFKCTADFLKMLFTIDVGNGLTLGLLMCVVFIFLPLALIVINFLKVTLVDEIDEKHDLGVGFFGRYVGKHEYRGKHERR